MSPQAPKGGPGAAVLRKLLAGGEAWHELAGSVAALGVALLVGAVLLAAAGFSVPAAYGSLLAGALGGVYGLADTLAEATPLLFTGLAVAFAFRAGLLNIGAEGQLYLGGLAAALVAGALVEWPLPLPALAGLAAGAAAGALWALLPGYLKARTGAHEVITTIMMNYIGILLTSFLVKTYFKVPGPVDQTALLPDHARLPALIPFTGLTWGLLAGLGAVVLSDWVWRATLFGYDLQAVGFQPEAAEYGGIDVRGRTVAALAASGALAGLAGAAVVLGVLHRFITHFSPGYGFTGIAVALLGRSRPWGVLLAALLFGALQAGGMSMQLFAGIPADLLSVVQGLVILFVSAPLGWRVLAGLVRAGRTAPPAGRPGGGGAP